MDLDDCSLLQAMLDAKEDRESALDEMYDVLWQGDIPEKPNPRIV